MNTLVCIGWIGDYICFLNVSREEAIRRYMKQNDWYTLEEVEYMTFEISFNDCLGAYEVHCRDHEY